MTERGVTQRRGGGSLYLRWRPRTFAEVVAQDAATRTLRNAVARGTVAHAYLLCGPRGTGKTSLARILYKAVNCEQPVDGDPCNVCASCEAGNTGRALDLIEIDAASNRGIDDIRSLRERAHFAPAEAKTKVYIVDEAHQLTAPAWDAFLKTLEEPPAHTVFVLATTAAHKVPATIVSRCQRFDLTRIPQASIADHLAHVAREEGIGLESGVADRLARLARGGLRDAIGMMEQVAAFGESPVTMEAVRRALGLVRGDALRTFVDALAHRDARRALEALEEVAQEGADLHQFLDEVLFELRSALLIRAGAEAAVAADLGDQEREWLREIAQLWSPGEIAATLRAYGEIEAAGAEEGQLLIRLELATASASGLEESAGPTRLPSLRVGEGGSEGAAPPAGTLGDQLRNLAEDIPPAGPSQTLDTSGAPSLAAVQARWPSVLDRYQGSLLTKLVLGKLFPTRLDEGVVTLEGTVDALDLGRLDSACRRSMESLLGEDFGLELAVRFAAGDRAVPTPPESADSLVDYASTLFGGRIVQQAAEL